MLLDVRINGESGTMLHTEVCRRGGGGWGNPLVSLPEHPRRRTGLGSIAEV